MNVCIACVTSSAESEFISHFILDKVMQMFIKHSTLNTAKTHQFFINYFPFEARILEFFPQDVESVDNSDACDSR